MSPFDDRIDHTSVDYNPPYYTSYSKNGNNYIMRQNNTPPPIRIPFYSIPQPYRVPCNPAVEVAETTLEQAETCEDLLDQQQKDLEMFISFYSFPIKRLRLEILSEINRLDQDGSFIYDKIPDRTTILKMVDVICQRILPLTENESINEKESTEDIMVFPEKLPSTISGAWLKHVIEILVCQDLIERRRNFMSNNTKR
ncbi:hypothetical protein [Lachnoclostridium phytofermentans]|uniref:Uncharacterized protein n=1 Tax=Lachnoclostridium phytofermentans (strain ATCC 700394 / DSM 18823 / ISDg) TaxID=357809 RepID=A9KK80_LACP7|nr:hypothetical protein [Lachnoclostridium phytofermentans]ABX44071.1 hypothetical protein Cphy_3724 [Lachnoclostridium phytofermentans ISDg]